MRCFVSSRSAQPYTAQRLYSIYPIRCLLQKVRYEGLFVLGLENITLNCWAWVTIMGLELRFRGRLYSVFYFSPLIEFVYDKFQKLQFCPNLSITPSAELIIPIFLPYIIYSCDNICGVWIFFRLLVLYVKTIVWTMILLSYLVETKKLSVEHKIGQSTKSDQFFLFLYVHERIQTWSPNRY